MALGAWCHGCVDGVDGLPGDAELADQGLNQESRGGDAPRSGGQGCGTLDGVEALVNDVDVAHMRGVEEALAGRAARELNGVEGRPWGEDVAEDGGVFVVEPWEDRREVVCQGTGEAMGATYVVADQTTAMFAEWFEGTYGGALGGEGWELVARREQELTLELGVSRVVLGMAGREGWPVPRAGEGGDGKEDEEVILTQRGDDGPLVQLETEGKGLPLEPRAPGAHPRIDGVWLVFADAELTCLGASCLQADLVLSLRPVDADAGRQLVRR